MKDYFHNKQGLRDRSRDDRGMRGHSSDGYGPQHWGEKVKKCLRKVHENIAKNTAKNTAKN